MLKINWYAQTNLDNTYDIIDSNGNCILYNILSKQITPIIEYYSNNKQKIKTQLEYNNFIKQTQNKFQKDYNNESYK